MATDEPSTAVVSHAIANALSRRRSVLLLLRSALVLDCQYPCGGSASSSQNISVQ